MISILGQNQFFFVVNQVSFSQDTAALVFEDVRLPSSALLGQLNQGFYYLMNELPQERLTIGIQACAHAEFMFEETKKYVMERKAYGKTLAHLQVIFLLLHSTQLIKIRKVSIFNHCN